MAKKNGFVKEFKEFISRGSVIDLAVGVIIGGAFQKIVNSLVNDIIMPVISLVTGGIDFNNWFLPLGKGDFATAADAKAAGLPLATTECWGITDYKDFPMLPWDWVKDLCALGVETACQTGQWALMATSNFAAPQFCGMWRDVAWHQRLTTMIHEASLPPEAEKTALGRTMRWK